MSIKITLRKIVTAANAQVLAHVGEFIPPGKYKFFAAKLLGALQAEFTGYSKQHNDLLKKYGKLNDKGQISLVGATLEEIEAFSKAEEELLDAEILIPYPPLESSKLGKDAEDKLTIADVSILGDLLVEGTGPMPVPTPHGS